MSVLNQSGEEQVECPLCMEPLEVDDLNFFPCTCGYQICRFCWHRIRTDENGLCPACRKAYSENPADFTPLSKEQVAQLKAEKRQRDQQRKAKLSESRKHLANVRVVQKNLVFVVGLPVRLADAEVLKRHEYFGKFGKIHKVVINQSTSYAGSQGPSASAYVTYMKSDDALRAIQNVNNITIDGRLIKSSLGTTKYCSHFMKNQPCPKPDCMYLHDFGDPKASFTKEQMHAGKHQEYERKLHDALVSKMAVQSAQQQQQQQQQSDGKPSGKNKESATVTAATAATNNSSNGNTNKENWPQLNSEKSSEKGDKKETTGKEKAQKGKSKSKNGGECNKKAEKGRNCEGQGQSGGGGRSQGGSLDSGRHEKGSSGDDKGQCTARSKDGSGGAEEGGERATEKMECGGGGGGCGSSIPKIPILDDNSSFFSQNTFQKIAPEIESEDSSSLSEHAETQAQILNDSLPNINSSEDWQAAFGFSKHNDHLEDLAKQRNNVKDTLETFGSGFSGTALDMFGGGGGGAGNLEGYHGSGAGAGYTNPSPSSVASKLQESILEALSGKHNPAHFGGQNVPPPFPKTDGNRMNGLNGQFGLNGIGAANGLNGLDQQMSKFFADFCKNGMSNGYAGGAQEAGASCRQSNGYSATHSLAERNLFLLQQRQLEEQLMSLNLKQQQQHQHQQPYGQQMMHNGGGGQFMNGDVLAHGAGQNFGLLHGQVYPSSLNGIGKMNSCPEDELDFDPFHETQKGFAELMENEQSHKLHGTGRIGCQINGLVHSQTVNSHIPPPPPGFMQSNTHMNSFGSKILPYLNMNTGQQQMSSVNATPNSWSGSYSQAQQQQQQQQQQSQHHHQQKALAMCNDWKILDPAIVQSSKHYMLANMQPREHYSNLQPATTAAATTAVAGQQLQNGPANYSSFAHINGQQSANWLGSELNAQIASPPGFRAGGQATKQQEC